MTLTGEALEAVSQAPEAAPARSQRAVDAVAAWLAHRTSRRGLLARAAVVGSALTVDWLGYLVRPTSAYAAVCGPDSSCSSGWTVFCATINNGVNACPPGSIAGGWWKADGASLCGGQARYLIDCNATCSRCGGGGGGFCARSCWSCSCGCGPGSSCDQRRVCCNAFRYGQCHQEVPQVGGVMCRVVSCTPPWRWERCSTAAATDNATRDHSSDHLPGGYTAITRLYIALGENGSALGASVYGEFGVPGGTAQRYQFGRISAGPPGVHETVGPVSERYVQTGAEGGPLGFPVTGTVTTRDGQGRVNRFERGRISSHPGIGAFVLTGTIAAAYALLGVEDGPLGFPVADQAGVPGGTGQVAVFQRGRVSQRTAGAAYAVRDVLAEAYLRAGGETGRLGYPVANEESVAGSRVSRFEQGRVSASAATGAHWMTAPIAARYVELGAEGSSLGRPVTDEQVTGRWLWKSVVDPQLRTVTFEHGSISYSPLTGQTTVGP